MDKQQLETYIKKLQGQAPEIINAVYEALDDDDIEITRKALREHTGCDMEGMSSRADALLAVIVLKAISGIQLTGEEQKTMNKAMAFREQEIQKGNWNPNFRFDPNDFV